MKPRRWLFFILITVWLTGTDVSLVSAADLYHGRVVDEETGQPLVGAVVTVIWDKSPVVYLERTRTFLSAQEAITDSEGKFALLASPEIDWNPFTSVRKPPSVVIYKPEYAPLTPGSPAWKQVASFGSTAEALKTGPVIKLPKLKTKEQLMQFVDLGVVGVGQVPYVKITQLVRQVNVQRVLVGLQPYPEKN
jgi:hypothetical protein